MRINCFYPRNRMKHFDWFLILGVIIVGVFAIQALLTTTQIIGGKKCKQWRTVKTWYGADKPTYFCHEWE